MFQNFGVQKISISEKSSEDLGMHISLPKPYAIFFRRFVELTTAIVWKAQVIVPSGMRIAFLLSKQILCFKSIYFKIIFGHLMSSLLVKIFSMIKLHPPTNRSPASHDPQTAHQSGSTQTSESCFGIPCATYSPRCPIFFSLGQKVSLSFFLLRSKKPKKQKKS